MSDTETEGQSDQEGDDARQKIFTQMPEKIWTVSPHEDFVAFSI